MICRLCLVETESGLKILSENGETQISKALTKYFHIEVQSDDAVSNEICTECWHHIYEFHNFWLYIEEKQKTLQTHLVCTQLKHHIEGFDTEEFPHAHIDSPIDSKDVELREPEIDMAIVQPEMCDDEAEFDAAEMEDDDISMDRNSLPSPLLPLEEHKSDGNVIKIVTKPKRKYTKRKDKAVAGVGNSSNKKLRSAKTESSKDMSNDVSIKDEIAKKQNSKLALIREKDDYIAENAQLSCCLCTLPLKDFFDLKKHFRQLHQCDGYVPCCNNRYHKRSLYVDHLKLHKDPDFLKCTLCNKQLSSRNTYQNHMDTKHPDAENLRYFCKLCPRKFAKQYILDYHIKSRHTTTRDYICKTCNKGFVSAGVLKQHIKAVHLNKCDSVCEICGKCFKTSNNLLRHMDAIHSTQPRTRVQCSLCQKWLKNPYSLKKHMIAHNDNAAGQEYKCPKCGMEKVSRHALAAHIRYHHSDKVYTCPMCSKEFKQPIALREHEATHTGIHLYTCSFCPKKFRSHRNLRKHKTINHSTQSSEISETFLNLLPCNEAQSQ